MYSFPEFFDDLRAECREIVGVAAGDEPLITDDFLVYPGAARILDILTYGWIGCNCPILEDIRLHQQPRPVTDHADGLCLLKKVFDEGYRVLIGSELVGSNTATGDNQAIEVTD